MKSEIRLTLRFDRSLADVLRDAQEAIESGELGDVRDNGKPASARDVVALWFGRDMFADAHVTLTQRDEPPPAPDRETTHQMINRLAGHPRITPELGDDLSVAMRRLRRGRLADARDIARNVEDQLNRS